jgi:(2R)-3-sulfolactate dehydrogenase (NADP+)
MADPNAAVVLWQRSIGGFRRRPGMRREGTATPASERPDMTHLTLADAETLVAAAIVRGDVDPAIAASVARALVAAEAAGQSGHGFRRVTTYAAQAKAGKVDGHARPVAARPAPGVLTIDAADGFAYPALDLAVSLLPDIARGQGVALAGIRRSHHAGVMGLTVERFAELGLVALMVANAPGAMAPWGGRTPLYGTNPIAFAAPLGEGLDPLVIDLSLSKVARGKVMEARQKGEALPEGWAFDKDGAPTTDAEAALAGTMVPAGDSKGAALALMVEMLAAGVTGSQFAYEASSLFDAKGPPVGLGHLLIVLDPQTIGGPAAVSRMADLATRVADEPGARLPGRRGQGARRAAIDGGIEVDEAVLAAIAAI